MLDAVVAIWSMPAFGQEQSMVNNESGRSL